MILQFTFSLPDGTVLRMGCCANDQETWDGVQRNFASSHPELEPGGFRVAIQLVDIEECPQGST